jgi:DNA-binding MarR family transcriptional regulator
MLLACARWLGRHGQVPNQLRLARQAGTDVKMTSQVVRRLEAKGLLHRQVDPGDTRTRRLRLTAEGNRAAKRATTAVGPANAQCFGPEVAAITALLQRGISLVDRLASTSSGHFRDERQDSMSVSGDKTVRANAVITVHNYEPAAYDEPAEGPTLTRIHVEERFIGDIQGDGVVEFLQAARADGSASFVGIERVRGTVAGRQGTFLLQDAGTVAGNVVSGEWFVVPGSGTGQLAGLRGTGGFRANLGEGAQAHLDYWFE